MLRNHRTPPAGAMHFGIPIEEGQTGWTTVQLGSVLMPSADCCQGLEGIGLESAYRWKGEGTCAWPWSAMARNLTVLEGPLAGAVLKVSCSPKPIFCDTSSNAHCQTML